MIAESLKIVSDVKVNVVVLLQLPKKGRLVPPAEDVRPQRQTQVVDHAI